MDVSPRNVDTLTRPHQGNTLLTMTKHEPQKPKRRKGLKANYGDATPEDGASAMLLHRPGRKQKVDTATKPPKIVKD